MANNIHRWHEKQVWLQEIRGYKNKNKKYYFLSFVKYSKAIKRSKRADHVNNVDLTCFCCWDDLSYGLHTLGPLYCKQICTSFHLQIFLQFWFDYQLLVRHLGPVKSEKKQNRIELNLWKIKKSKKALTMYFKTFTHIVYIRWNLYF